MVGPVWVRGSMTGRHVARLRDHTRPQKAEAPQGHESSPEKRTERASVWSEFCGCNVEQIRNSWRCTYATTRCEEREAQAPIRAHQAQRVGARPIEQGRGADRGRDDEQDPAQEGRDQELAREGQLRWRFRATCSDGARAALAV